VSGYFEARDVKSSPVIRQIFISAGHNFFGRHGQVANTHGMTGLTAVWCRAGWGLAGDRFYGYRPDYNGQVTFFSWEVVEAARREFNCPELGAEVFRRNVIVEGCELNALVATRFTLGGLEFAGISEARPCHWMNTVVAPGAEAWLKGRGGLRAKILTDGELRCGPTALIAPDLLPW
jgi:MOSC domain-containing protein YiiM